MCQRTIAPENRLVGSRFANREKRIRLKKQRKSGSQHLSATFFRIRASAFQWSRASWTGVGTNCAVARWIDARAVNRTIRRTKDGRARRRDDWL